MTPPFRPPLRCLLVEDDENDALLVLRELRGVGGGGEVTWHRVETAAAMQAALDRQPWDVIISDFKMPHFNGLAALELLRASGLDIPFIVVSGTIGEDVAVAMMKAGANDYLMKGNLARLRPAVERELREATERREHQHAEQKLRAGEEQHRAILQSAMDGFWLIDTEGQLLEVNETYCRMSGYSERELLTKRVSDLDCHDPPTATVARNQTIIAQGQVRFESRHRRKDGSVMDVEVSIQHKSADGGRYVAFIRDITERKQAETYREMSGEILRILLQPGEFREAIQRVLTVVKTRTGADAVGIRLQDGDDFPYFGQVGFSPEFLQTENSLVTRAADGELCRDPDGNPCLECACGLVIAGRTEPANPLFTTGGSCWLNDSAVLSALPPAKDSRCRPRDQCVQHGYASLALIPIRSQSRIVGLIQLNDRRKGCFSLDTVAHLEGIAAHLGEALSRLQAEAELRTALAAAETAARVKGEFLSVMSHELRTPLNGVLGFAELLSFTTLDDDQQDSVRMIRSSGDHLLAVVNDILDFASLEKGTLALQGLPVTVAALVTSACLAARKSAVDKGLEFHCEVAPDVPEQLIGDERRLRQILINLLGNAVKFTVRGSVVLRLARRSDSDRETLEFAVEDTGIGISPATLGFLFRPFSQGNTGSSRAFQGTGLGLAISQRLAEAMGSSITVASAPGRGSTFSFRLPLVVPAVEPSAPLTGSPIDSLRHHAR